MTREEYLKNYYIKNRERLRVKRVKRYIVDKERILRQSKQYRDGHKKELAAYRRKRNYNLTEDEYNTLLKEQQNKCAICGCKKKLGVDHDHLTGEVRGLLCQGCNRGMSFIDMPDWIQVAIEYKQRNFIGENSNGGLSKTNCVDRRPT